MEPALSGCFICYDNYDLEDHLPRILPLCGHTVCESCLKSLFDEPVPKCPFDKVPFTSRNVFSFPQNYVLKEMLDQRAKFEFCPTHGDKIRFGCITCKKRICSYCAFVDHKEHTVKPVEEMEAEMKRRKQELENFVETLDKEKSKATNKIEELRTTLENEAKTYFDNMLQKVHEKKNHVEELISKVFLEEKDKFKSKLYVYEIEKIRVLNMMKGPQDFYSISETNTPDISKFLAELSEAEKNFESAYVPQLTEINKSVKELSMNVQKSLSKLEIQNPVSEEHKNEYQALADKSYDFGEWYAEESMPENQNQAQQSQEIVEFKCSLRDGPPEIPDHIMLELDSAYL